MQDNKSPQTPDKTNKQLQTFLKRELSQGHTVIQYSSAVHHAEAGAISATFHQLFMSWLSQVGGLGGWGALVSPPP